MHERYHDYTQRKIAGIHVRVCRISLHVTDPRNAGTLLDLTNASGREAWRFALLIAQVFTRFK